MPATPHTPNPLILISIALLATMGAKAAEGFSEERPWKEAAWVELGGGIIPEVSSNLRLLNTTNVVSQSGNLSFDPGFALYGGFRESFSEWLAAEVQGGFLYNGIDEMNLGGGASWTPDASLLQVPIMANLVVQIPTGTSLVPYAGAGAGAMVNWLEIDDLLPTGDGGSTTVNHSSTEINFAYQVFAGLRYDLGSSGSISLAYHLIGCDSPQWSLDSNSADSTATKVAKLEARDMLIHSLTVGFHLAF